MGKYNDLSDQERRKLVQDFRRAAEEIRSTDSTLNRQSQEPALTERQGAGAARLESRPEESLFRPKRYRRPAYTLRIKIDSYAFSEGYEICGLEQLLASLFSFLSPFRDRIHRRFVKALVQDSPYRGDPSGYSLSRTLLELQRTAESQLKGGSFLKRDADRKYNVKKELARDLASWEPEGYKLLNAFRRLGPGTLATLDALRAKHESGQAVDVFELVELVKPVMRAALLSSAPDEAVRERLAAVGELIKSVYRRIYSAEDKFRQVSVRIDQEVEEFLACWARLKWFAHQLFPALLKMLRLYCREEQAASIAPQIMAFVGLDPAEILALESPPRKELKPADAKPEPEAPAEDAEAPADGAELPADGAGAPAEGTESPEEGAGAPPEGAEGRPSLDLREEYRGILTILVQAFPGCRIESIADGDFSCLFWFHQKIFSHLEYRGPLVSRRPDFNDLLWKLSHRDPVGIVIVLHELIGQMLESLNPETIEGLLDPLATGAAMAAQRFLDIRGHWALIRETLLLSYLKEVDYYEKELSLYRPEAIHRFLASVSGRKSVETLNQMRNHLIEGYGHVALKVDRQEFFRCPPLYAVTRELCAFLDKLRIDRAQLGAGNPLPAYRLETPELLHLQPGPLLKQIESYLEAVPAEKRLLANPQAETNRIFLEILYGAADLLHFLLSDQHSPLRRLAGEALCATEEDKAIRAEIDRDRTPLRVELKKDFEEIDRLTGLLSKSEYLRLIPGFFQQEKLAQWELAFLVLDLDRFKTINDTLGHEFGDALLKLAGQAILSCSREEDLAVRFGGDELLVILNGDCLAGMNQAERIRRRYGELLAGQHAQRLEEIPRLIAEQGLAVRERPLQGRPAAGSIGTLSIGIAQGLGPAHPHACADERQLFERADRMLYLAKDLGGGRSVAMVDALEVPLTEAELAEYRSSIGERPEETKKNPKRFIEVRKEQNRPLAFSSFSYEKYLTEG